MNVIIRTMVFQECPLYPSIKSTKLYISIENLLLCLIFVPFTYSTFFYHLYLLLIPLYCCEDYKRVLKDLKRN